MSEAPARTSLPELSIHVWTFAAEDPGGWQHVLDQVTAADEAGVDRVVVSDHVVFGEHLEAYARPELGGAEGGRQPTGPDGHWLEPLTVLSVLCGLTSRIRLGTNILIAALRRPVVLAKTAATLDVLSGGRLDLGVGVGWQREEYDAAGLDFDDRGRLLDHSLAVCQTLWEQQRASFASDDLSFDAIHLMPKPLQPGGLPIWVSGTVNRRVVRRLARFGSGWIPWGPAAADVVTGISQMRDALAAAGRDPGGIGVVGTLPVMKDSKGGIDLGRTMEQVSPLVEAGVTDFRAGITIPLERAAATDLLGTIVPAFRAAAGR